MEKDARVNKKEYATLEDLREVGEGGSRHKDR